MTEIAIGDHAAHSTEDKPPEQWLIELKAKRGDRPRDKARGRWLADFLDQDTASGLLPIEKRLLDACAIGASCSGKTDGKKETVRAGFLRFLALGGDESAPVHESGVELYDAFIDGELDLRGAKVVGRLALVRCDIRAPLKIEDASLGILYLEGSHIAGISGNRVKIGGSVFLQNGFVSDGSVSFFGAEIGGSLQCTGAKIFRTHEQNALVCTAAKIGGNVLLNNDFAVDGCVWLNNAKIGGALKCGKAKFSNGSSTALNCDVATIASDVELDDATVDGKVSFVNARVGADFRCTGVKATGQVSLYGADIGHNLICSGGHFVNEQGYALVLDTARIASSLYFDCVWGKDANANKRFEAKGGVSLRSAAIGRDFSCAGGRFVNANDFALVLDTARIASGVFLNCAYSDDAKNVERFDAEGGVSLYGADIGLDLRCSGGHFVNATGEALMLATARIKGAVYLDQMRDDRAGFTGARFEAEGTVNLYGADISGNLECVGGRFVAQDLAIRGDAIAVGGCVFFSGPTREELRKTPTRARFTSNGEVRLVGAQIGMQLNCISGEFVNKTPNKERNDAAGYALNLGIASIKYELLLGPLEQTDHEPATITGSMSLSGAKARELADRGFVGEAGPNSKYFPKTIPGLNGKPLACDMSLQGFTYDRLSANSCLTAKARKAWLKRQPKEDLTKSFRHQPFEHLVTVLRAMGHQDDARDIAVSKQWQLTRLSALRLKDIAIALPLWRTLFGLFMSFGHRPARGVMIALVIAAATGWFYEQAAQHGALTRKEPGMQFHPYIYSLDVMLPVVKLGEAEGWKPSRKQFPLHLPFGLGELMVCDNCTQYVVWGETVFGWLAGGLLLALVAGLIKKD